MNFDLYFKKALTYEKYVYQLGENQNLHNRHYERFKITADRQKAIKKITPLNILVLTEPWCGDSLAIFPVVRKLAETNGCWLIKVLRRDENTEFMDHFLTRGGRAIPIFLFLSEDFKLIFRWGPRPYEAQQIFETYRQQIQDGEIEKSTVIKKIRMFYSRDRGQEIMKELLSTMKEHIILYS